MYGWGSTVHGELALGGIEAENIFIPREVEFMEAGNIKQSMTFEEFKITIKYETIIARRIYQRFKLQFLVEKIIQWSLLRTDAFILVVTTIMDNLVIIKRGKDCVSITRYI